MPETAINSQPPHRRRTWVILERLAAQKKIMLLLGSSLCFWFFPYLLCFSCVGCAEVISMSKRSFQPSIEQCEQRKLPSQVIPKMVPVLPHFPDTLVTPTTIKNLDGKVATGLNDSVGPEPLKGEFRDATGTGVGNGAGGGGGLAW